MNDFLKADAQTTQIAQTIAPGIPVAHTARASDVNTPTSIAGTRRRAPR